MATVSMIQQGGNETFFTCEEESELEQVWSELSREISDDPTLVLSDTDSNTNTLAHNKLQEHFRMSLPIGDIQIRLYWDDKYLTKIADKIAQLPPTEEGLQQAIVWLEGLPSIDMAVQTLTRVSNPARAARILNRWENKNPFIREAIAGALDKQKTWRVDPHDQGISYQKRMMINYLEEARNAAGRPDKIERLLIPFDRYHHENGSLSADANLRKSLVGFFEDGVLADYDVTFKPDGTIEEIALIPPLVGTAPISREELTAQLWARFQFNKSPENENDWSQNLAEKLIEIFLERGVPGTIRTQQDQEAWEDILIEATKRFRNKESERHHSG